MNVQVHAWGSSFDHLADQVFHMLNEIQGGNYFCSHAGTAFKPRVNLYETPTQYLACAELPGVAADRIEVRAEPGRLRIGGFRAKPELPEPACAEAKEGRIGVHQMEIDWGRFEREIRLAPDVEVDAITAVYRQGFLWVLLPRTQAGV